MTLTRQRQRVLEPAAVPAMRTRTRLNGTTTVTGTREAVGGQEEQFRDHQEVHPVDLGECPWPAYMRVSGGVTKNMDNFEFVRLDVSIEWPFPPTVEALEQTGRFLSQQVDQKVAYELDLATGALDPEAEFSR